MQGTLLLDGLYLATAIAQTGGATDAIRLLPYVHVVGVTLLCSYRTGLKLALWHTLLFLLVIEGARAGVLQDWVAAGLEPGAAAGLREGATLTIAGLWVFALGTAVFSAASERQLRGQKHDLSRLSAMVAKMDADPESADIPNVLLEELTSTFRFARGVVLASLHGDLELLAWTEPDVPTDLAVGVDRAVSRAWEERTTQLLREIDPETDPRLASLLPDARHVLVVPLLRDQRQGLGAVVVERGNGHPTMRRWVVAMVEQFAEHAALALHNAWLTEERESQLRTIQGLELQLRAHNEELEAKVAERTEELREVIAELRDIDEQRRRLLEHVVRAAEEERTRIAHDIHDDPVQKIVAMKMRLELLRKKHPDLPDVDEALEVMKVTIKSMRTLLFDLSPPTLEEEGLASALTYLLENSSASFDWTVDDDALVDGTPGPDLAHPVSHRAGSLRERSQARGSDSPPRDAASAGRRHVDAGRRRWRGVHPAGRARRGTRTSRPRRDPRAGRDGRRMVEALEPSERGNDARDLAAPRRGGADASVTRGRPSEGRQTCSLCRAGSRRRGRRRHRSTPRR